MFDVVALGELLIDFTCNSVDSSGYPTMTAHPGGAPANFLAALSRFGAKTRMIGKVGNDAFGKLLINTLKEKGIDTDGMLVSDDVFTTLAFVTIDESGDREFSFARKPGADTCICFDEIDLSIIDSAKVFHFGTLSLTHEPAKKATISSVQYARSKGKIITFDPNLRRPLWNKLDDAKESIIWGLSMADIVKISDEEVEFLFCLDAEAGAKHIVEKYGCKLVFVTCGADGCYYRNKIANGFSPSLSDVKVVDTTGAGDIFGGSALWKILQLKKDVDSLTKSDLEEISSFACTSASLSTTRSGGISSVPELSEVEKFLSLSISTI